MIKTIKNNISADILILRQKSAVAGAFALSSLILVYILFTSSTMTGKNMTGYYLNQACTVLTIINVFAVIIVGSFLGAVDNESKTYCIRQVNTGRMSLCLSRILLLLGATLAFFLFHALLGGMMDIAAKSARSDMKSLLLITLICVMVPFLWSSLAYLLASSSGNFSLTATIVIGLYFMESFLDRFMPRVLLEVLPVWNQKNLLIECFPEQVGAVAVVQQIRGDFIRSLFVILIYIVLIQSIIFAVGKKKQYK